jgi:hypothetical protein
MSASTPKGPIGDVGCRVCPTKRDPIAHSRYLCSILPLRYRCRATHPSRLCSGASPIRAVASIKRNETSAWRRRGYSNGSSPCKRCNGPPVRSAPATSFWCDGPAASIGRRLRLDRSLSPCGTGGSRCSTCCGSESCHSLCSSAAIATGNLSANALGTTISRPSPVRSRVAASGPHAS